MFLDDQLYEKVKQFKIEKSEDFQALVNELYKITEDYYKPKLKAEMSFKEVAAIIDKAFKLWDMFIVKLEKENWFLISILKDGPYKKAFMGNERLKEIYDKGKK